MDLGSIAALLVATLGGAAIGLERQWSGHASGAHARFGGIRTFTLLGGVAGLAGWLSVTELVPLAVVLLAGAAGLVVAGYVAASRADIDGTTEAAALVVLAAGTLAGAGHLALSSAVVTATAVLLLEKTRLHAWVAGLDDASLRASVRFAAMACVILPLLPAGPYGPLDAVRPRELWALVLFFSGLSFVGWIARRLVGAHRGLIVSGLLGGVVSSTSVTFRFARDSRAADGPGVALAGGAIAACTVMLIRVTIACAVLNPTLAAALPRYLWLAFLVGAVAVFVAWRLGSRSESAPEPITDSPLQLGVALQMTVLFQVVLFVILMVQSRWSSEALVATSAIVGLTDLDALTLSLARSTTISPVASAVVPLVAGILSNTLLKLMVVLVIGRGAFRVSASLAIGAVAVALVVALML